MVDFSITEEVLADGKVRYNLGEPNWAGRRIPDIHRPGSTIQIRLDRMIDVIILGDGFTDRASFRAELEGWLASFYSFPIYETFAGCFRIRALYTPSNQAASAARGSYYRTWIASNGEALEEGDWPNSPAPEDVAFRDAIFRSVDLFTDANLRRYPASLDIGDSDQAITNEKMRDRYRNLVVSLLVRSVIPDTDPARFDLHVSGRSLDIPRSAPNQAIHMGVAVGATELHEFGHAFGQLADEYIDTRGLAYDDRKPPSPTSVFSLSNLWFSNVTPEVPWVHLSPGGWQRRAASGQDPSPVVGWMWVGGTRQYGVWHAEYTCLMNGSHENFAFTQVADNDPTTIDADGNVQGKGLRDLPNRPYRFCLWCQEIVALRILEKTDQLLEPGDSSDITTQGTLWWDRWVERLRANYRTLMDVDQQILDAEAAYAATFPGKNGEPLWQSDLYAVPTAPHRQQPPRTEPDRRRASPTDRRGAAVARSLLQRRGAGRFTPSSGTLEVCRSAQTSTRQTATVPSGSSVPRALGCE